MDGPVLLCVHTYKASLSDVAFAENLAMVTASTSSWTRSFGQERAPGSSWRQWKAEIARYPIRLDVKMSILEKKWRLHHLLHTLSEHYRNIIETKSKHFHKKVTESQKVTESVSWSDTWRALKCT